MPQPNYNEGVASVAPEASTPNDYLSSSAATPAAFGGQIAQGLEKFGEGAQTSSKFFGKVAADDASNNFQDFATKLLHGDPSKTTAGPDGQPMPDTGYLGTRGRATLEQRPGVEQQMTDKIAELRAGLQTPEQQLEFDNFTRRYRSTVSERIGSHADGQATTWYSSVNTAGAKIAMDHISNNFDNPKELAAGFQDLTSAYVRQAQLSGAQPGDPQYDEALASARRDGLQAQLNAMAVKDPSRAMAILDKNKDIAGVRYDDMARSFQAKAEKQQGDDIAGQAWRKTYQSQPGGGYQTAALTNAGAPYGISGGYLQRVHQLENVGNDPRENQAGAQGPFQFTRKTAQQYGLPLNERNDFEKSADAAARFAADNKAALTSSLGRPPTDAELYLAHQQGAGGAASLLAHPNVRAGDLVGDAAIRQNGGDPNAPASSFTGMWTAKFNGAGGAAMQQRKAGAFQDILADPTISEGVRQHALTKVSQMAQADQIAMEQDSKARKAATDGAVDKIYQDILNGSTKGIIDRIANDPALEGKRETLYNFAVGAGGVENTRSFGAGYTDTFRRILANPDDPGQITDKSQIIALGPGGTGDLTTKGVTELLGTMDKIRKQPDQAGVSTVKSAQLEYYKNQFAIDQNFNIPGMKPFKNQAGLDKFNHEFVPAFEAAYSDWIAHNKNPMDFLNDKQKLDDIMNRVYPPSARAKDAIKGDDTQGQEKGTVPPAPEGTEPKAWQSVIGAPPRGPKGDWPYANWAAAVDRLRTDPSDEVKKAFDAKFGPSGYTADAVLKKLPPKPFIDPNGSPAAGFGGAFEPPPPAKPLSQRIPQTMLPPKMRAGYQPPAEPPAPHDTYDEDLARATPMASTKTGIPVEGPADALAIRG